MTTRRGTQRMRNGKNKIYMSSTEQMVEPTQTVLAFIMDIVCIIITLTRRVELINFTFGRKFFGVNLLILLPMQIKLITIIEMLKLYFMYCMSCISNCINSNYDFQNFKHFH